MIWTSRLEQHLAMWNFIPERLADCNGDILEPGVGTGRILIPLLEKGLNVDGFDVSEEMLSICQHNCEERNLHPTLFIGKMESFSIDKKYEAIIVPTGTFLLLHQREDSLQALENFYRHLDNGGRLIIDIFLQPDVAVGNRSARSWETKNGDLITLETTIAEVDYIQQYTVSHHRYEKWRNGSLIRRNWNDSPSAGMGWKNFACFWKRLGFNILSFQRIIDTASIRHWQTNDYL